MAIDTLKIEFRDAARRIQFHRIFTPIVYLNLFVEITIDVVSELNAIYERMFGRILDLRIPHVWAESDIFYIDLDRTEMIRLQFQG